MGLSLTDISPYLLKAGLSEPQHIRNLKKLSTGFTTEREKKLFDYQSDEELVSSYTLFYLPTNAPKLEFVINQLPDSIREDLMECQFIDFGTGPGTYLYAFLEWSRNFSTRHYAVDMSSTMLDQAEKVLQGFFPNLECGYNQFLPDSVEEKSILFFGHSLNEMGLKEGVKHIKKLTPEYVFAIEPGTKESFSNMLKLREEMKVRGYSVIYPCAHLNSACPIEEGDWCHQVFKTKHDESVERLSQLISRDRKSMPMIAHLYKKTHEEFEPVHRLVRLVKETKFSWIWDVCLADDELRYQRIEVLKKEFPKKEQKQISKISAGVGLTFELNKVVADIWRVKNVVIKKAS